MPKPPLLIVFDLDFTLWDAGGTWCDHLSPPFHRHNGRVRDADGAEVRLYPDVPAILDWCDEQAIPLALASRTGAPDWARHLLDLFDIRHRFPHEEIYPGNKDRHFHHLHRATGLAYTDMLFFDDETRNIYDVENLGVKAIHVPRGLTWDLFKSAVI